MNTILASLSYWLTLYEGKPHLYVVSGIEENLVFYSSRSHLRLTFSIHLAILILYYFFFN